MELLLEFPDALEQIARVREFGIKKYSKNSYNEVPKEDYYGAILRHLIADSKGETEDHETKLSHLASIALNAILALQAETNKKND